MVDAPCDRVPRFRPLLSMDGPSGTSRPGRNRARRSGRLGVPVSLGRSGRAGRESASFTWEPGAGDGFGYGRTPFRLALDLTWPLDSWDNSRNPETEGR